MRVLVKYEFIFVLFAANVDSTSSTSQPNAIKSETDNSVKEVAVDAKKDNCGSSSESAADENSLIKSKTTHQDRKSSEKDQSKQSSTIE